MSRLHVALDAGHGGSDPGAQSEFGPEKDYTLLQTHVIASILNIHNMETVLTRLGDNYVALSERVDVANGADCDAFISVHFNASRSDEPSGTQVLYYKDSEGGEPLAEALLEHVAPLDGATEERWERVIPVPDPNFRDGFFPAVVKYTRMPAVILETEFGTNPDDAELLFDPAYMVKVAESVGSALEDWMDKMGGLE